MIKEIILPWFAKELNPNTRCHWSKKAAAVKLARAAAHLTCIVNGLNANTVAGYDGKLHLWIDYYAKTRNFPDTDNCLSASKAYLDGIADALGVNDRRFVPHPFVMDETVKGGQVRIRITRGPE